MNVLVILLSPLILIAASAPIGATVCGAMAISRIRRSGGRIYGLGLAIFDALVFPLLALDGLIAYACITLARLIHFSAIESDNLAIGILAAVAISALADFFIIRWVWRASKPTIHASTQPPPQASQSGGDAAALQDARQAVKAPAWALIIVAASHVGFAIFASVAAITSVPRIVPTNFSFPFVVVLGSLFLAGNLFALHAASGMKQLKNRQAAVAACVIVMLPFSVFGLIAGIWALVVLSRREVVEAFKISERGKTVSKSRTFMWLLLGVVAILTPVALWAASNTGPASSQLQSQASSQFPSAAHSGNDKRSAYVVHAGGEVHYVFFYPGRFTSNTSGSQNAHSLTWIDNGSVKLTNGQTFGFLRESADPLHLSVNGKEYDLRQGRVLVLRDDGSAQQVKLFPTLAVARDAGTLAKAVDSATVTARPVFGAVVERTINDLDEGKGSEGLKLATGEVVSLPAEFERMSNQQRSKWIEDQGIDLFVEYVSDRNTYVSNRWALMSCGLRLSTLNATFEAASPEDAQASLASTAASGLDVLERNGLKFYLMPRLSMPPLVFAFQTREGGVGLLEVTSYTNNPKGMKIRYKMLPGAVAAESAATQPATQAVTDLALKVLRAMKEEDFDTLKSLSAGSEQGWLEVDLRTATRYSGVAGELPVGWSQNKLRNAIREIRTDVFSKHPEASTKVLDTMIHGDWAAALSPVTSSQYLVMVFVRTAGGWRFATLDDSKGRLADDVAKHSENIPKNLKLLRSLSSAASTRSVSQSTNGSVIDVQATAGAFLVALRNKDVDGMKALSLGSVRGWVSDEQSRQPGIGQLAGMSVRWLGKVIREMHEKVYKADLDLMTKIHETAVDGDWAAVRIDMPMPTVTTGPTDYLVLFFLRTSDGWRFVTIDDAEGPLAEGLAARAPRLQGLLASPSSQPATH